MNVRMDDSAVVMKVIAYREQQFAVFIYRIIDERGAKVKMHVSA